MDFAKVSAEIRPLSGKGAAHRTRVAGKLPAVLYGHQTKSLSLALDPVMLVKALDKTGSATPSFHSRCKVMARPRT